MLHWDCMLCYDAVLHWDCMLCYTGTACCVMMLCYTGTACAECPLSFWCSELSGRELVAELLYAFLLPEVEKQTMRDRGVSSAVCVLCAGGRLASCLALLQCATTSAATC